MAFTVIFTDDFNRAALGADWEQLNSTWGSIVITANTYFEASASNTNNEAVARWIGAGTITADQRIEVEINGLSFLSGDFVSGAAVRAGSDTDGARDLVFAYVAADSPGPNYTVVLGKVINGTRTVLHSAAIAWADGDILGLTAVGDEFSVDKNGTLLGGSFTQTITDTEVATGTLAIVANGTAINGDNVVGGNITAGSTPTASGLQGIGEGFEGSAAAGGLPQGLHTIEQGIGL